MDEKPLRYPFAGTNFLEHLNVNDPLALVIRAHLYVESALIGQIESALLNKDAFDSASMPFPTKVKLALALGKLDADDVGFLTALNRLRVRFAHNLETQLTDQDELDLYNIFPESVRRAVDEHRKADDVMINRLRRDLTALIFKVALKRNESG